MANLPCGHNRSLLIKSVESDYQFCDLCETRKRRNDAEKMEGELRAKLAALKRRLDAPVPELLDDAELERIWQANYKDLRHQEYRRVFEQAIAARNLARRLAEERAMKELVIFHHVPLEQYTEEVDHFRQRAESAEHDKRMAEHIISEKNARIASCESALESAEQRARDTEKDAELQQVRFTNLLSEVLLNNACTQDDVSTVINELNAAIDAAKAAEGGKNG